MMKVLSSAGITHSHVNFVLLSEVFLRDTVTVVLNWTYSNNETPFYHHLIFVPHLMPVYLTNTSIQLILSYNTLYTVSIPCGNGSRDAHIELVYGKTPQPS